MSVLIKDMVMPETCDDCPFHVYHNHYEFVCKATPMLYHMNLENTKGIRKEWCPLSEVPPTQTERPRGEWILVHPLQSDDPGAYMCSECRTGNWEIDPKRYFFCPYCGADMRGEQDG